MSRILLPTRKLVGRRKFLGLSMAGLGATLLGGCDRLSEAPQFLELLGSAEGLTYRMQRLLGGNALAREFSVADLSPDFKVNGTHAPDTPEYAAFQETGFANWRLRIDGLVAKPLDLSLADLRAMPQRTQITRHDCVEGWSAIGKWGGVPFSYFLKRVGADLGAKYVGFKCDDDYHTSIDMATALHPQTNLALTYDGQVLPAKYGYPVKLRMPTKLGHKNPKHIRAIYVTNTYPGGYWEDQGYNWFGGS